MQNQTHLCHVGVLGMKWGVRKTKESINPKYSKSSQKFDLKEGGEKRVANINRKMNAGKTIVNDFLLKNGRNMILPNGNIVLSPKNYRVVADIGASFIKR